MNSTTEKADVVIIGGGLAGLSTGIALAGSGIDTAIVETRRASAADVFGFLLWPPGTRCLQWLGVLPEARAAGAELEALSWFVASAPKTPGGTGPNTGDDLRRTWLSVRTAELGAGVFLGILPSRLEEILRAAALRSGVRILDSAQGWSLTREPAAWTVHVDRPDGTESVRTPLLVGADGAGSRLRDELGLTHSRWQPRGQAVVTGVGGPVPRRESRQALSAEGSGGCVSLGEAQSWLYAVVHESAAADPDRAVRHYATLDPEPAAAFDAIERVAVVRPWNIRVPRWAADGAVLMGDAAHGMLPHFGLGGSLTLEDVPILCEVLAEALRTGDTCAARLAAFQERRRARTAYAQRTSNQWARLLSHRFPGVQTARDLAVRRLVRDMDLVESFYRELASPAVPRLSTRAKMLLL
ncbi:NAD(P)/FAD-dependent oxidoreductase [Streptomyces sp. JJ36]|uniref:FAD-dependent oxidoreductase n=1 Tax=Streptomyces sp. JJ36 TaxID=2736645 RepID=UPI001F442FD0|nr:NAD(P)/FAD-dependent oxidoreductase [Streptomyces sp. JJ36]MCF6524483.1 FAD-dependent monooxygenase [Streptomyces sp. JJ36]